MSETTTKTILLRDAFLNAPRPTIEPVEVPALGGSVYVRQITAGERDEFELRQQRRKGRDVRTSIVILVACDPEGRRIFTDDDAPSLKALPTVFLEPIINAHLRINAVSSQDVARMAED